MNGSPSKGDVLGGMFARTVRSRTHVLAMNWYLFLIDSFLLSIGRQCQKARKEMVALLSSVIQARKAEQASGTSSVEKTDLLQVRVVRAKQDTAKSLTVLFRGDHNRGVFAVRIEGDSLRKDATTVVVASQFVERQERIMDQAGRHRIRVGRPAYMRKKVFEMRGVVLTPSSLRTNL